MPSFQDLTGQRFGRWVVLRRDTDYRRGIPQWLCRCECGTEGLVRAGILKSGQSRSCGCLNRDVHREMCIERNTTHGMSRSRTHRIWANLTIRCDNEKSKAFKVYGARGIKICDRWRKFENFLADMGQCPSDKHTLDRLKNAKGYEPDNCRWATMREQQNNRTNNRTITFRGRTQTLEQWARETGIESCTIRQRLGRLGWTLEQALTLPPDARPRAAR